MPAVRMRASSLVGYARSRFSPQVLLICTIVYLFVMKPTERAPRGGVEELTEQEIDDLCKEWQPEPLVPPAQPAAPRHAVVMDGPPLPRCAARQGTPRAHSARCSVRNVVPHRARASLWVSQGPHRGAFSAEHGHEQLPGHVGPRRRPEAVRDDDRALRHGRVRPSRVLRDD